MTEGIVLNVNNSERWALLRFVLNSFSGSSVKTGPARKLNTELKVREQAIAAMKRKTQEDDSSVPFKIFKSLLQDNVTLCSPCDTSDAVNPMNQNTDSEVFIRDKGDTSNKIEAIRETASKFDSENKQVAGNEIEAIRETDPHPEIQASENSDENKEISQPRVKMVTVSTQYEEDTTNFKSKDHVGRKGKQKEPVTSYFQLYFLF